MEMASIHYPVCNLCIYGDLKEHGREMIQPFGRGKPSDLPAMADEKV